MLSLCLTYMNKLKNNQSGFSAVELILILALVAALGAIGFLFYKNQKKAPPSTTTVTTKTTTAPAASTAAPVFNNLPAGYQEYKSDSIGFRFGYPKEWGTLKSEAISDTSRISFHVVTAPYANPAQDLQGTVDLISYKASGYTLSTEKYGATIKPNSDGTKWIITEVNPASADRYKVGGTYELQAKHTINGGTAYVLTTQDEGCTFTRYIVKLKDTYTELSIPALCSTTTVSITNQAAYDTAVSNILSSMTLY